MSHSEELIEGCRQEVDSIDKEIVQNIVRRMGVVKQIAEYKKLDDLPIVDEVRENKVIDMVRDFTDGLVTDDTRDAMKESMRRIFTTIIEESRRCEITHKLGETVNTAVYVGVPNPNSLFSIDSGSVFKKLDELIDITKKGDDWERQSYIDKMRTAAVRLHSSLAQINEIFEIHRRLDQAGISINDDQKFGVVIDHSKEFLALSKEERESKRYELPEAVSIWICDFSLPDSKEGEYIDEWALYSRNAIKSGTTVPIFTKNKYIMISLPQFKKSAGEIKDSVDAWLYLLNHAGDGKELPDFGNKILEEALERIKVDNADDELLTRQEKDMVTKEEFSTIVASRVLKELAKARTEAQAEGLAEGRAEGREKGLAEGRAEGREKGLAEGRAEGRSEGIDILESLGVSSDLIEKARKIAAEKAKESPSKP